MERMPKGIYTPEFRAEAVKLVEQEGLSVGAYFWLRPGNTGSANNAQNFH